MKIGKLRTVRFKDAVDRPLGKDGKNRGNAMFFTAEDQPGTPGYDLHTEGGWVFIVDRFSGDYTSSPVANVIQAKALVEKAKEVA